MPAPAAGSKRSGSPGIAVRAQREGSAGFRSIRSGSDPTTRCTGRVETRRGTTSARSATPPTCRRTTIRRQHLRHPVERDQRQLRGLSRAGLGSRRMGALRPPGSPRPAGDSAGLLVSLGRGAGAWEIEDAGRGIAQWVGPARTHAELDAWPVATRGGGRSWIPTRTVGPSSILICRPS